MRSAPARLSFISRGIPHLFDVKVVAALAEVIAAEDAGAAGARPAGHEAAGQSVAAA